MYSCDTSVKMMLIGYLLVTTLFSVVVAQQSPVASPIKAPVTSNVTSPVASPVTSNVTSNVTSPVSAPSLLTSIAPTPAVTNGTIRPSDATTILPSSTAPSTDPTSFPSFVTILGSDAPTNVTGTGTPTLTPTRSPINITSTPTAGPTASPSVGETESPTGGPTAGPTVSPTGLPTWGGTEVKQANVTVVAKFDGVVELSSQEIATFAEITETWFDSFFESTTNERRKYNRGLQRARNIRNMETLVDVTGHKFSDGVYEITYNHFLNYVTKVTTITPAELALRPYGDEDANSDLAAQLRRNVDGFKNLKDPIPTPELVEKDDLAKIEDDGGLGLYAIIGIAAGGAICCLLIIYAGVKSAHKDDGTGYADTGSLPPSQFNINVAEDISTMEDPTVAKLGSGDASIGHYGDQSVATVDYDYSKAYGGGGDNSVVSSVGGTLGDNTRHTAGDLLGNSARAALGANFESDVHNEFKEQIIVINAPAGKLGVVIDTPDDGAPVVHAVKDTSVIADKIQVGDKLIAVDEDDVRQMTAIKVSKLISKKSANPNRKLTVVRSIGTGRR